MTARAGKTRYPGLFAFRRALRAHTWPSPADRRLAVFFADSLTVYADGGTGGQCFPGWQRIEAETGLSRNVQARAKALLVEAGFLTVSTVGRSHRHAYQLTVPEAVSLSRPQGSDKHADKGVAVPPAGPRKARRCPARRTAKGPSRSRPQECDKGKGKGVALPPAGMRKPFRAPARRSVPNQDKRTNQEEEEAAATLSESQGAVQDPEARIAAFVERARQLPGWRSHPAYDRKYARELMAQYSALPHVEVIADYDAWLHDHNGNRPRNVKRGLRNWCRKEVEIRAERAGPSRPNPLAGVSGM